MHIIKKCRKISRNIELNNFTPKTEEGLLKSLGLGITRQTIQNYKKLAEMIPELEDLVDTGIVTTHTVLADFFNNSQICTRSSVPFIRKFHCSHNKLQEVSI